MKKFLILSILIFMISCSIIGLRSKSNYVIPGTYNATFNTKLLKNHSINITFTEPNKIGWRECNIYSCNYNIS